MLSAKSGKHISSIFIKKTSNNIIIMKILKKAAEKYLYDKGIGTGTNITTSNVAKAFIDGVEFSQKWTDVNDELPTPEISVIVKCETDNDQHYPYFGNQQYAIAEVSEVTGEWRTDFPITHWRYINLK